jgi:hypothetical protein
MVGAPVVKEINLASAIHTRGKWVRIPTITLPASSLKPLLFLESTGVVNGIDLSDL